MLKFIEMLFVGWILFLIIELSGFRRAFSGKVVEKLKFQNDFGQLYKLLVKSNGFILSLLVDYGEFDLAKTGKTVIFMALRGRITGRLYFRKFESFLENESEDTFFAI